MNETGLRAGTGGTMSPDSDCNSNQCNPTTTSLLSNTSSQDIDFQDNSDYQWFLDYGYRDGGSNHHTSILSLAESYDANDLRYYDALAKNMDANLAEADMESFRTEDIHALLTNLPPMCTDHPSQETTRVGGECYASVSGSMMAKFDLDSSLSPHSSSQGEGDSTSMSICKSELLFSPVKETAVLMPGANFSVDSLDCDMMLTCQANKDNYTIAFEASITMYSEDSDYRDTSTDKSEGSGQDSGRGQWSSDIKNRPVDNIKLLETSMSQSDSGSLTTWSKLKKRSSENQLRRHPSGNNNNSTDDTSHLGLNENSAKSQSMPNLYKQKLRSLIASNYLKSQTSNTSTDTTVKRRPVKVFDIQNQIHNGSGNGSISDMATSMDVTSSDHVPNKPPNISLVKLFMKQKSMSTEGMSTTMDQLSSSDNWPGSQSGDSNCSDTKNTENMRNLEVSAEQKLIETSTRTYELIAEEPEEEVTRSESVEQLSESISKLDSMANSYENECKPYVTNNNNSFENVVRRPSQNTEAHMKSSRLDAVSKSIQTSNFSEMACLKNIDKTNQNAKVPFKVVEPSFLNKLKREGEVEKPIYVVYPNYVLPDLNFLNEAKKSNPNVRLVPQKPPNLGPYNKRRPLSCNDVETLKKRSFGHIKDWDSLNFLLPAEYKQMLADIPELSEHIKPLKKESKVRTRPMSCDISNLLGEKGGMNQTNVSSSSSTGTQPSSGYRGSSTILNESPASNLNPLFVYRYDSVTSSEASSVMSDRPKTITTMAPPPMPKRCVSLPQGDVLPPRPPLPKGIIRKGLEKVDPIKRYSMYETSEEEVLEETPDKRRSLPVDTYFTPRSKRFSETEDEGVDAGTSSSSLDEHQEPPRRVPLLPDELAHLDELLKLSCGSCSSGEEVQLDEASLLHLRSYVSKYLSMRMPSCSESNRKTVSFAHKAEWPMPSTKKTKQDHLEVRLQRQPEGIWRKRELTYAIMDSLEMIADHFETAASQQEQIQLADSYATPAMGKLLLENLCPVLYALLHDGLKPHIKTEFGDIGNSVWQVVEASARQGPLTKSLNDLVMKINSEDVLTEGTLKFNAFVMGLLNLRSLDAWLSYLRTRESILTKHYTPESFLLQSHTHVGTPDIRQLMDSIVEALKPLVIIPFRLDLLFEYRQLQASFLRKRYIPEIPVDNIFMGPLLKKLLAPDSVHARERTRSAGSPVDVSPSAPHISSCNSHTLPDLLDSSSNSSRCRERPRSCVEPSTTYKPSFRLGEDVASIARRRWSGISSNSKIHQVYERLAREDDEEYTDSLENNVAQMQAGNQQTQQDDLGPESLDSNLSDEKPLNGRRFKKLQQKWEMLSNKESIESTSPVQTPTKSRIPRPITSPVKPSAIPVFTGKPVVKKVGGAVTPPASKIVPLRNATTKRTIHPTRTSRVDQKEVPAEVTRHVQRPSSLPYKTATPSNKTSKITPPRRAVSSSLNRKPVTKAKTPKVVRTLSHRLASESGHLSYNEGERLKMVLEVDQNWLLCCRGNQKGLVPKSAVISADNDRF